MKFHLLTKMILFILLPALAGQALIAGLSYQRSSRAMQEQLENHMALMVKMQADGLLHVYEGLVREMQELGESGPVRDLQTAHGKVDEATMTALRQRASAYLAEVAERHPVVSLIGITDATGRITAHSVARSIGTSRASKGYFQRAMKGISSTEDVKSETTGEFRTFFCIPILGGADGKTPIGSMYAAIHNYKLARMSINSVMEEASSTALASAAHLSEAATAMNEMNVTTQEVARNASDASGMSVKTREHAAKGSAVVQEAERGIQQVQEQMQALKDDILRLNTHAQSISRVMNVISDIADQTNLLALNAAIEAARAGDAGRGFAVVADEVRKLAEKTMSATAEVSQAIVTIQQNTASTMNSVDATVARMEEATVQAHASGEALTRIVSDVETTADEVRAIATAGEEQSAASEEISRSIVQVSNMSEHTAQAIQDAAGAVTSLKEQTDRLRELIARLQRS